jgi:Zn-finger nucleic acid-binding protein
MSKDSRMEDEWFARHEEELLRQARRERRRKEEAASAADPPKCPRCGHDLQEEDISGVTIDRCVSCEGIFLDRGELEAIMLQKSEERRGFFRKLMGFGSD